MARISKQGLDYYPQGVDFLQDRKVKRLMRKHGPETVAILVALYASIYGEKGYYLEWNDDACFDLSEMANCNIGIVQGVITDAMRMELLSGDMFRKHGVLTSEEIQKQYLQCTVKRKNVELKAEYKLVEEKGQEPVEEDSGSSNGINVPQNLFSGEENPVCDTEMQQRKEKEIESKLKEKKTSPLTPSQNGGGGGETPQVGLEEGGKDLVLVLGRKVPRYCLNKQTHNYDGLLDRLTQIHITDVKAVNTIIQKCDYGRIGHPLWGIISHRNWPTHGIKFPAKYLLSQIKLLE